MWGRLVESLPSADCSLHTMGVQERLFPFLSHSSCKNTGGNSMPPLVLGPAVLLLVPGSRVLAFESHSQGWNGFGLSLMGGSRDFRRAGCAEQSSLWNLVHSHSEEPKSHDLQVHCWHSALTREPTQAWGNGTPWPQVPDTSLNRGLFWHLGICHRGRSLIRNKESLFIGKGQQPCNLKLVWFLCVWSRTENRLKPWS